MGGSALGLGAFTNGLILYGDPLPQPARAISSAGERFVHTEEVTGSIPVSPTQVSALINDLAAKYSPQYSTEVQQ
jgi:hypothetical protein